MKFNPPIESREDDDLMYMVNYSSNFNPEAVSLAWKELARRGISEQQIKGWYERCHQAYDRMVGIVDEQEAAERAKEQYTAREMLTMIAFWWVEIFNGNEMKREGYHRKARTRRWLMPIGALFYLFVYLDIFKLI